MFSYNYVLYSASDEKQHQQHLFTNHSICLVISLSKFEQSYIYERCKLGTFCRSETRIDGIVI